MIDKAILCTLQAVAQRYGNGYCVPSQNKILELLQKYHGVALCRRTLCYRLRGLERSGAIKRIKRHYRNAAGVLTFRTTAFYILPFAHKLMKTVANLANRFFKGFRVQSFAHNTYDISICNKEGGVKRTNLGRPAEITGILADTLARMNLKFGYQR